MLHISEIKQDRPEVFENNLRRKVYDALDSLGISFRRVDTDEVITMEEILGTKIGAATVFGVLLDESAMVQVVFDKEVAMSEWYGCSDGVTTGYMKLKTEQVINDFLHFAKHEAKIIEV